MPRPLSRTNALIYGVVCATVIGLPAWFILKRYEEIWNNGGVLIVGALAFLGFIAGVIWEIRAHGEAVARFEEGHRGPGK